MRHSMAWPLNRDRPRDHLRQAYRRRDQDLALHQIDAGDRLGHRMLHLNARVHFDEVQVAGLIHQKLDGAGVGVADVAHGVAQAVAIIFSRSSGRDGRRRRFFEQLLMPALDGAFALAQNLDVAVLVGQHLKLDMPRRFDQLLHVHVAAMRRRRRASCCACVSSDGSSAGFAHHAHAAPAAARRRFQHHRIADAFRRSRALLRRSSRMPSEPGRIGMPHFAIAARACCFSPMRARHVRLRADELDARRSRRPRAKSAFSLKKP